MNRYLLAYDTVSTAFLSSQVGAFIESNKYIHQWSLLFHGAYFLKSSATFTDLESSISKFFSGHRYVLVTIAETHNQFIDGSLSTGIWQWFVASETQDLHSLLPDLTSGHS